MHLIWPLSRPCRTHPRKFVAVGDTSTVSLMLTGTVRHPLGLHSTRGPFQSVREQRELLFQQSKSSLASTETITEASVFDGHSPYAPDRAFVSFSHVASV